MFYAYDREPTNADNRSVPQADRDALLKANFSVFNRERYENHWKPVARAPYCLSVYLTGVPDPQRSRKWVPSFSDVEKWANSLEKHQVTGVLFVDELLATPSRYLKLIRVPSESTNIYLRRWKLYNEWVQKNREYCSAVWMTDSTDCELANPFPIDDGLYCGDEPTTLGSKWMMREAQRVPLYQSLVKMNPHETLLNAGVLGGSVDRVLPVLGELANTSLVNVTTTDMVQFNLVMHQHRPTHGRMVTSLFKSFQADTTAWWRHK
jgi:hypothetical protein